MKLKNDILEKFEKGAMLWDIAKEYNTSEDAVLELLGLDMDGVDYKEAMDKEWDIIEDYPPPWETMTPSQFMQDELEPIWHSSVPEHDESDELEGIKNEL
jgi:hypothetical protein